MARPNPSLIAGGAIVGLLALAAALGPLLVRADPLAIDLTRVLAPPGRGHWLGCDALGRDMLARVLWGARLSLAVSTTVVLFSLVVGSIVGGAVSSWLIRRGMPVHRARKLAMLACALAVTPVWVAASVSVTRNDRSPRRPISSTRAANSG